MDKPSIVCIEVNDPDTPNSYKLRISGRQFDLVDVLLELEDEEHQYLLEARDIARDLQKQSVDPIEALFEGIRIDLQGDDDEEVV